jgi:putative hydrolase of the HAD superfamily
MTIQAVFFDMGGTIETFGWTPELRLQATAGIQRYLKDAGVHLDFSDNKLYEVISTGLDAYHQVSLQTMEELSPQRVWAEFILANYSLDFEKLAAVAEELMLYIETRYFERAMRPEIPMVLESLKKMGLKIGLISNVNSRGQVPANLSQYGIRNYFDPVVLSSEYGRRKPDPAIFHYAARLANVPTGESVYVGDRISRDIVGARKAGYRLAVKIHHNFDHGEDDSGAKPDAVIHQMTELLDILAAEREKSKSMPAHPYQVRALLFDAGDILYHRPKGGQRLREFLAELGIVANVVPDAKKEELRNQAFHGVISQSQYRRAILHLYGITEVNLIERGSQAMEQDDNGIRFFKGVRETLLSLKEQGYMLGIITDTANPIHVKLSWFERGGFGQVWDSIITSQEIGVQKPDPRIYSAALQQLGLLPCQAVFVGHSPEELDGAHAVGMKTIAFNFDETAKADYYIEKFTDLLTVPVIS